MSNFKQEYTIDTGIETLKEEVKRRAQDLENRNEAIQQKSSVAKVPGKEEKTLRFFFFRAKNKEVTDNPDPIAIKKKNPSKN